MQSERRKKHEKPRRWEMDDVAAATTFACTHQEFLETLATTVTSGTAIDQFSWTRLIAFRRSKPTDALRYTHRMKV